MYKINEDLSIYVTRGDIVPLSVSAVKSTGETFTFSKGDIVKLRVFRKKNASEVVLTKEVIVTADSESVQIFLSKEDTKIGGVISKPVDYWYEVELNPDTDPQTFIGYDENGPKIFRLFPEGADNEVKGVII